MNGTDPRYAPTQALAPPIKGISLRYQQRATHATERVIQILTLFSASYAGLCCYQGAEHPSTRRR
eukprot:1477282-Rhodomonas_salina.1